MKWEFVSADSADAADRLIAEILSRIRPLASFPNQGHRRPDSPHGQRALSACTTISSPMQCTKNRFASFAVIHGRRDPRVMAAILRSRE